MKRRVQTYFLPLKVTKGTQNNLSWCILSNASKNNQILCILFNVSEKTSEWDYFDLPRTAQMGELNAFHSDCKSEVKRIWWSDFYLLLLSRPAPNSVTNGENFWLRVNTINPSGAAPQNLDKLADQLFVGFVSIQEADFCVVCQLLVRIVTNWLKQFLSVTIKWQTTIK